MPATGLAATMMSSWPAVPRLNSPVMRPPDMTMILSLILRISGISDEIMMMPIPSDASLSIN